MYDDFMAGMNYGVAPSAQRQPQGQAYNTSGRRVQGRIIQVSKPTSYNKTPQIYMINQYGDTAELWANGDVYIRPVNGEVNKMRYPSRPFAIKQLTERGWVLKQ